MIKLKAAFNMSSQDLTVLFIDEMEELFELNGIDKSFANFLPDETLERSLNSFKASWLTTKRAMVKARLRSQIAISRQEGDQK